MGATGTERRTHGDAFYYYVAEGIQGKPLAFQLRATSAEFQQELLTIAKSNPFDPNSDEEEWYDEDRVCARR
jgi:hypothetical protein